jgi:putative ABC transport system permease protein
MTLSDLVQSSIDSLRRTKGRSVLTMIGIIIGIMSVIMMLSIGEAAQRYILNQISSFGSDILFLQNGAEVEEGQPSLFIKESLTLKDIRKLKATTWATMVVGRLIQSDTVSAYGYDTNAQVVATMPDEIRQNDIRVGQGFFFTDAAIESHDRVAVLGFDIASAAFGSEDPIGKIVKIGGQSFRVVGVMEKVGSKGFQNVDKQVYIPLTAGLDLYNKKYLTYVSVKTSLPINEGKEQINVLIREMHNIDNPEGDPAKDDFHIQSQEDLVRSASQITNILQILLVSIAAISLIVGGIGIMNIMYVSVTERIKEIGLRKSIGARRTDVLKQFLAEALFLTLLGGLMGTLLGVTLSWLGIQIISQFQSGWTFAVSVRGIVLGVTVSGAIGVIFGYFPARKAASLHPIEALRFE